MMKLDCIKRELRLLAADTNGNFGILFALISMPLLVAAGAALDYSKASTAKAELQNFADSAALASGAMFDGTNKKDAVQIATAYLEDASGLVAAIEKFDVDISGQTTKVQVSARSKNNIMRIVGIEDLPISVVSHALTPLAPKNISINPTNAQGWYYKKVSIIVTRPEKAGEEVVGTVTYQPTTQANGGKGTMVKVPSTAIQLGEYSKLILKMEIKKDGCPIGANAKIESSKVTCIADTRAIKNKYDLTLRTDDPDTSDHLFVDGVQLQKGVLSPLNEILECNKSSIHAWEDGGGFSVQDFFYTVEPICVPDGKFVRLIK